VLYFDLYFSFPIVSFESFLVFEFIICIELIANLSLLNKSIALFILALFTEMIIVHLLFINSL
jgi:hypothetical protein